MTEQDKLRLGAAEKLGWVGCSHCDCKDLDYCPCDENEFFSVDDSDADLVGALLVMVVEQKCTSKYMDGLIELYDETLVKLNWEVFIAMQTPDMDKIRLSLNALKKG